MENTTASSKTSRPEPKACACGAFVSPQWLPTVKAIGFVGRWDSPDLCTSCYAAEVARQKTAAEREWVERLKAASGMGPKQLRMTWDAGQFIAGSPLAQAMQGCLAGKDGLLLLGPVGVGKTYVGCAMLNRHIETTRMPGIYVNVPALMGELRSEVKLHTDREHLARLCNTPFLVLDDIGAEKASDFSREALYTIFEHRLSNDIKRMVVISNLTMGDLVGGGFIGERSVSRLTELCKMRKLDGEDRRLLMRQQDA